MQFRSLFAALLSFVSLSCIPAPADLAENLALCERLASSESRFGRGDAKPFEGLKAVAQRDDLILRLGGTRQGSVEEYRLGFDLTAIHELLTRPQFELVPVGLTAGVEYAAEGLADAPMVEQQPVGAWARIKQHFADNAGTYTAVGTTLGVGTLGYLLYEAVDGGGSGSDTRIESGGGDVIIGSANSKSESIITTPAE